MSAKLIRIALLAVALAILAGCSSKGRKSQASIILSDQKRRMSEMVILTLALPETPSESLVLNPKTFRRGVYICAIENLSKPCLPKLSALVAEKVAERGIVVEPEQDKAEATVYFETWFDSFSSHSNALNPIKGVPSNPTLMGKDFAAKIEQSLTTGSLPDVHPHIREGMDPFSMVSLNSDDEQKYIYVAFTAVEMADAIDYPGEGEKHLGASKNPWIKPGTNKKVSWWAYKKMQAETRTLIGGYNGEVPTEKAVMPMLKDAIDLLLDRVNQPPKKK